MPTMAMKGFSLSFQHVLFSSFKTAPSVAHARRQAPSPALLEHRLSWNSESMPLSFSTKCTMENVPPCCGRQRELLRGGDGT